MGFLLFIIGVVAGILVFSRLRDLKDTVSGLKDRVLELEGRLGALRTRISKLESPASQSEPVPEPAKPPAEPVEQGQPRPKPAQAPRPVAAATSVSRSFDYPAPSIDWENFLGVKLFAWLGGFALFLGMAFFVKFSIEHNLISPLMRVCIGFVTGIGVIISGLLLRRKGFDVTVQTLCAAGIGILYANTFACRSLYGFLSVEAAFGVMILVTVAAFLLAVRLDSKYVAVLGLVGGFLTPVLLSTGVDRAIALFSYIALLDIGLVSVAIRKRWGFLMGLSLAATFIMELGWTLRFFTPAKAELAVGIYLAMAVLYLIAREVAEAYGQTDSWFAMPAAVLPLVSMGFVAYMFGYHSLTVRPGLVLSFLFVLNAQLSYLAVSREESRPLYALGGGVTFALLAYWTVQFLKGDLLMWGLGYYMAFAILHTLLPILLQRLQPTRKPFLWGYAAPLLMLLLILFATLFCDLLTFAVWPFVLLISLLAIAVAWLAASLLVASATILVVMACLGAWLFRLPDVAGLPGILSLVAFFACTFFAWSLLVTRRRSLFPGNAFLSAAGGILPEEAAQLPALSAIMPFLLLAMVCMRLKLPDPSQVFGLALLMTVLLLALVRYRTLEMISLVAIGSVGALEYVWHWTNFTIRQPAPAVLWYLAFYMVFMVFPFLFRRHLKSVWPWITAALAGPVQFLLFYNAFRQTTGVSAIGLVPAFFAIPPLLGLASIVQNTPKSDIHRSSMMAWFGGVALLFITAIIPVQFDKEWITLGWALEGAALLWLYHRVPHEGLKGWGLTLLGLSFVRLTLNPAVFSYHPRTSTPILNWYLWVYGASAASFFAAARLLAKPRNWFLQKDSPPILNSLGAILVFLLLNIEIADCFSTGSTTTFQFSGNFAQDMTYSLAWAVFAIVLLVSGIRQRSQGARYASLGLLTVTIIKVFLHDLWRLGQLFRVASFIGLAVILILVSFLYQRYVAQDKTPEVRHG